MGLKYKCKFGRYCENSNTVSFLHVAEGIMFHIWPTSWNESSVPKKGYPWQHYIAFTMEPAAHIVFFKYVDYTLRELQVNWSKRQLFVEVKRSSTEIFYENGVTFLNFISVPVE